MRAALLLALVLCACEDHAPSFAPPPARKPRQVMPFTPPAGFERVRFGLVPYLGPEAMLTSHAALASYLSDAIHVPVGLEVGSSYSDAIERFERGEYDLIELSALSYARLTADEKIRCVAQSISDGSATGAGYLFVRDDSRWQSVEDLKGARLGLVDPISTTGSLFAKKLLRERGYDLDRDFASVDYLGNHEAVVLAVLDGGVDVGATYQGSFSALWRSKAIDPLTFRVIAKTARVPRDIYCVSNAMPDEAVRALAAAFESLSTRDPRGRQVLGPLNLNGFVPPNDASYEQVRSLARELTP